MNYYTIIPLFFCIFAVSIHGLEKCPGVSSDSQEYFKWKYDAAPIVVYGTVSNVQKNTVTLAVNCVLKGQLSLTSVELSQLPEVMNSTECHYLTTEKKYVVFLESMKTASPGEKTLYRLADMEEIEINSNNVNAFLEEECADEDDYELEMTIFYFDNNVTCGQFSATCNQATRTSILALNYPPLTKGAIFLGGFKKILPVPTMEDDVVSGKQSTGTGDEQYRGTAMLATICMPMMVFLVSLVMKFNF